MCAVPLMVPSRSSSSGAPVRANFAQAPQRDLDVAGAELDLVVEVLELALVPDLHGAAVLALAADADALGVVAGVAERRGAAGADPFLAALVAALLLGHALLQRLQQLVEAAHRLDLLLLLLGEVFLGELLQPLGRNVGRERLLHQFEALEHMAEHAVELVEVALVLHQRRARQIVEILDAAAGEVGLHRLHQRQVFAQRHRHAGGFQLMEEGDEHRSKSVLQCNDPAVSHRAVNQRRLESRSDTGAFHVRRPLASTLVLLAPALWNGYPLLQYDTGGYLARWFEGYLVPSRSTATASPAARLDFWPASPRPRYGLGAGAFCGRRLGGRSFSPRLHSRCLAPRCPGSPAFC